MNLYVRKLEEQFEGTLEGSQELEGETQRIIREVEELLRKEQRGESDQE